MPIDRTSFGYSDKRISDGLARMAADMEGDERFADEPAAVADGRSVEPQNMFWIKPEKLGVKQPSDPKYFHTFTINLPSRDQLIDAFNKALGRTPAPAAAQPAELTPAQKAGKALAFANERAAERQDAGIRSAFQLGHGDIE